jgi:hypothetical protein
MTAPNTFMTCQAGLHADCCLSDGRGIFDPGRAILGQRRAEGIGLGGNGRMRQQATRELLAYWNRLRGEELAPDRADVDLAAIRGMLSDLFMLDLDAAHQFPFLMSGTRLNAFFCAEQLGRSFLGLWRPQDARNIAAALMTAIDAAYPILAAVSASPEGYRDADIEILLLPLRHGGHAASRLLGLATPAQQPQWVGLLPTAHFKLRALRRIEAYPGRASTSKASALAFAAKARTYERPTDIRGHLRVFDGGK